MRMLRESASRQPCSAFSCIEVTRKRPSGEKVASRCAPFHSSSLRRAVDLRKPERHAIVMRAPRDDSPWAGRQRPAHRRRRAPGLDGAARRARAPACRRSTRRPCRASPARRSSGPSRRRSLAIAPSAAIATTRPSSPPVSSLLPSLTAARIAAVGVGDDAPLIASGSPISTAPSASASAGAPSTNAAATTCAPGLERRTCWVREVGRPARRSCEPMPALKPRRRGIPCGCRPRRGRGR